MAVFLAASDESIGEGIFHYAGYVAPLKCWNEVLVPAWEREVLEGPPPISEFHITELRSRSWRDRSGITKVEAERRIDAAVNLINQTKGMVAVRATIDESHYDNNLAGFRFRLDDPCRAPLNLAVDYPAFLTYVYQVLLTCSTHRSVEKVNFVIEKKKEVFPAPHDFLKGLGQFTKMGYPRLAEIIGELIPGDKKRVRYRLRIFFAGIHKDTQPTLEIHQSVFPKLIIFDARSQLESVWAVPSLVK